MEQQLTKTIVFFSKSQYHRANGAGMWTGEWGCGSLYAGYLGGRVVKWEGRGHIYVGGRGI